MPSVLLLAKHSLYLCAKGEGIITLQCNTNKLKAHLISSKIQLEITLFLNLPFKYICKSLFETETHYIQSTPAKWNSY